MTTHQTSNFASVRNQEVEHPYYTKAHSTHRSTLKVIIIRQTLDTCCVAEGLHLLKSSTDATTKTQFRTKRTGDCNVTTVN